MGTFGGGLDTYNPLNSQFALYQNIPGEPQSLSNSEVFCRLRIRVTIRIGTLDQLDRIDTETGQYTHYQHDPENPNSLNDSQIYSLYEDDDGIIWIGTSSGGLNRFDPATEQFAHFVRDPNTTAALTGDDIQILVDTSENLWYSSIGGGLSRFDPATEQITATCMILTMQIVSAVIGSRHFTHHQPVFSGSVPILA